MPRTIVDGSESGSAPSQYAPAIVVEMAVTTNRITLIAGIRRGLTGTSAGGSAGEGSRGAMSGSLDDDRRPGAYGELRCGRAVARGDLEESPAVHDRDQRSTLGGAV